MAIQKVYDVSGQGYPVAVDARSDGSLVQRVSIDAGFAPPTYDQITLDYTGVNLTTVIYKLSGATVGTLTLTYDGSTLTGVARS